MIKRVSKGLLKYLIFERMVAPTLLKILFWPAAAASIYYSILLIRGGLDIGWIPLTLGTIFVRVLFEGLLVFFSINDRLGDVKQQVMNSQIEDTSVV